MAHANGGSGQNGLTWERSGVLRQVRTRFDWQRTRWGLALGGVGLLLSETAGLWIVGRAPANPMPWVLAFGEIGRGLGRGLLYVHWRPPLVHLGFLVSMAGLSVAVAWWREAGGRAEVQSPEHWARTAVLVNVAVAAFDEIDALMLLLFFAAAGFISVTVAGALAGWLARLAGVRQAR